MEKEGLGKSRSNLEGLEKVRPSLRLKVAGPFSEKVNHLFSSDEEGYELLGFVDNKKEFFRSIDLLVHPAKLEAFGMVITEALSSGYKFYAREKVEQPKLSVPMQDQYYRRIIILRSGQLR